MAWSDRLRESLSGVPPMPKQPAIPGLRDAMKKKWARRELFRVEMETVVPRGRLLTLIAPYYPDAWPKGGRPPYPDADGDDAAGLLLVELVCPERLDGSRGAFRQHGDAPVCRLRVR